MAWNVTAELSTDAGYAAATAWLEARIPVTKEFWLALRPGLRDRAFTIAGIGQLDLIQDALNALAIAVEKGETLSDFKARIGAKLAQDWGETMNSTQQAQRLELIFRNAVQKAYNAGRYALQTTPAVLAARPYWQFDAVLDSRTTDVCRVSNGVILPASSIWWASHYPPLHHRCRSSVRSLTAQQPQEAGVTPEGDIPAHLAGDGFGQTPSVAQWTPDAADYDPDLWAMYAARQPAAV